MTNHKIINRILIVMLLIFVFLFTVLITIVALEYSIGTKESNKIIAKSAAVDIISDYSSASSLTSLTDTNYIKQTNTPAYFPFKLNGQKYDIKLLIKNTLTYTPKNKAQSDDSDAIKSQTDNFIKNHGFGLTTNNYAKNTNIANYSTYENGQILCALIIRTEPLLRSFSCIDKSEIAKQYKFTNQLFDIYKKANTLPSDISSVDYIKAEKDKVAYAIVNFRSDNKTYMFLYGFAEKNWEYIGDLLNNDAKYLIVKNTITPDMKEKISDAKYNNFLAERFLTKK